MRRALPLLLILLLVAGCKRQPLVIPTMFESGRVDPLADVPEDERANPHRVFYATDRQREADANGSIGFSRHRAARLSVGHTNINFGGDGDWPRIVAATRGLPEGERFGPRRAGNAYYGELLLRDLNRDTRGHPYQRPDAPEDSAANEFIDELQESLQASAGKSITIYIHGFNNSFNEGMSTAAEYELYTGGLGPFILYSWPSYDSLWEYSHDRDSVRYTAAAAREFVEFLAWHINEGRLDAQRINFIAHSTGAEVVGSVLRELALITHDQTAQERRDRWRIGSVLLVAPDVSTDVARARLLSEDIAGMYEQIVVYSSDDDRALHWASRMLYRTSRIGAITEDDLTEADRYWLTQSPNVMLVDVDSSPYSHFVHHSHHRFSPAVASDIILCLRSDLGPEARGLVREEGQILWHFADDYEQRVTEAAVQVYGEASP